MGGRFTLITTYEEIIDQFDIQKAFDEYYHTESFDIAPTQKVVTIINDDRMNRMGHLKWGLIPSWAKDAK